MAAIWRVQQCKSQSCFPLIMCYVSIVVSLNGMVFAGNILGRGGAGPTEVGRQD